MKVQSRLYEAVVGGVGRVVSVGAVGVRVRAGDADFLLDVRARRLGVGALVEFFGRLEMQDGGWVVRSARVCPLDEGCGGRRWKDLPSFVS